MENKLSYFIFTRNSILSNNGQNIPVSYINSIDKYHFIRLIFQNMNFISSYYPYFDKWLEKVFNELNTGKRTVIFVKDNTDLAGICILKHTFNKNKICTYWVNTKFRYRNIGSNLLYLGSFFLSKQNALVSIPQFSLHYFKVYIKNYIFIPSGCRGSLYKNNISEYFFTYYPDAQVAHNFFRERISDSYREKHNSEEYDY